MLEGLVRAVWWLILLAVLAGLLLGCHSDGGRAIVGEAPRSPKNPPATRPTVTADERDARIRQLDAELHEEQRLRELERQDAHRAITDAQARWATWAAGLTFLGGVVWIACAIAFHLPVRWGAIGAGLGVALLVGARSWAWLGAHAHIASSLALAGGLLMLCVWLLSRRWQHRLPRWLSRLLH